MQQVSIWKKCVYKSAVDYQDYQVHHGLLGCHSNPFAQYVSQGCSESHS